MKEKLSVTGMNGVQGLFYHSYSDGKEKQKALIKTTCLLREGNVNVKGVAEVVNGNSKKLCRVIAFGRALATLMGRNCSYTEDWNEYDTRMTRFSKDIEVEKTSRRVMNVRPVITKRVAYPEPS
jgi:hypothetical protein